MEKEVAMATLREVKENSLKSATAMGHEMGIFTKHPHYGHIAYCAKCFFAARVNEYNVPFGKAIESRCLF